MQTIHDVLRKQSEVEYVIPLTTLSLMTRFHLFNIYQTGYYMYLVNIRLLTVFPITVLLYCNICHLF